MAEELLDHYHQDLAELKLVPSKGGRFEISVDGKLIFSKLKEGRFPDAAELRRLIDQA